MNEIVEQAVTVLRDGGIIIFPTDTAFGIGCRMDNEESVKRLFALRKRPVTKATPVLFSSISMVQDYVTEFPAGVLPLMNEYWPGALTIVLPAVTEKVPSLVRGGGHTIGTRIPHNITTLSIIDALGYPILGPSANFHSEKTPFHLDDLDQSLVSLVDYVVPGECSLKQASTVLDVSEEDWKIIRQGAVTIQI